MVKLALSVSFFAMAGILTAREKPYLVALGPAPLRFLPHPTIKPSVLSLLPPLVVPVEHHETPPAVATNQPAIPTGGQTNQPANPPPAAGPSADIAPTTNSVASQPIPPAETHDPGEPAMVDPQSVIGYLAPVPSKTPDGRMPLPAFVPPAPPSVAPPSSHATYESH
jgi:hypothetical protein